MTRRHRGRNEDEDKTCDATNVVRIWPPFNAMVHFAARAVTCHDAVDTDTDTDTDTTTMPSTPTPIPTLTISDPAAPQPRSPAAPQPRSPAGPQPRSPAAPQPRNA